MAKVGLKMFHVAFSSKNCVEGFITDDPRDANWTATGKPASNCVPTIGDGIRELLDNPKAILPRKWAVVFDTEEEAFAAMQAAGKRTAPMAPETRADLCADPAMLAEAVEVLLAFAKEADAWEGYHDDERLVEGFPEYYGNIRVKDVRRAKTLLAKLENRHDR